MEEKIIISLSVYIYKETHCETSVQDWIKVKEVKYYKIDPNQRGKIVYDFQRKQMN